MTIKIDRTNKDVVLSEAYGQVPAIFYLDESCDELEETVEITVPREILEACK